MTDEWTIRDTQRGNEREADSRSEAEDVKNDLVALGARPDAIEIVPPGETDGGSTAEQEPDPDPEPAPDPEPVPADDYTDQLPDDPPVDTDPLAWIPDEFTDRIDGTVAINRKGFEVLAHYYDISVETDLVTRDNGTVIHKAEAVTPDGQRYTAYGEAHADVDDQHQLIRLSDTRAFKRSVSRATGIGMVAVEELKHEL